MKMTNFETLIEKRTMKKKIMIVLVRVPFCYYLHFPAEEAVRQLVRVNKVKKWW